MDGWTEGRQADGRMDRRQTHPAAEAVCTRSIVLARLRPTRGSLSWPAGVHGPFIGAVAAAVLVLVVIVVCIIITREICPAVVVCMFL